MSKISESKEKYNKFLEIASNKKAEELIQLAVSVFGVDRIVLASSLSLEDQVLTHILKAATPYPRIFTLETGRLFSETYDTMERTSQRYGFQYEVLCPDSSELEKMLAEHGPNLFFKSVELRKLCCHVRKIQPLKRVLSTADAWICGLRKEQSITRGRLKAVEWDEANGIIKVNPLHDWTESEVREYIKTYDIPYNPLQDLGYRSIGCEPCTRPIDITDDIRSGRWWWEEPEHKECGLHVQPQDLL